MATAVGARDVQNSNANSTLSQGLGVKKHVAGGGAATQWSSEGWRQRSWNNKIAAAAHVLGPMHL